MLNLVLNILFNNTDWSVVIDIISIIASTVLSITAIVISVATLKQSNYVFTENNRANIVFYIDTLTGAQQFLTLKNFGNSVGKIISVTVTPSLDYRKNPRMPSNNNPVLVDYTGILLAPNQCVKSWFPFSNYPDKKFKVHIEYKTLGETYKEDYSIDLSYLKAIDYLYKAPFDVQDEKSALVDIGNTLRRISEK